MSAHKTLSRGGGRVLAAALAASSLVAAALAQAPHAPMAARAGEEVARLRAIAAGEADASGAGAAALPEPLRRYFAYTGVAGRPVARLASFRFSGEVRLPLTGDRGGVDTATPWMQLTGEQTMARSAAGVGYVWLTRWTNPRFVIDVRDRYIGGDTHVWAVRDDGTTLIDEGHPSIATTYLIRFFAEATQSPTMLLPGAHLRWEAIDSTSARAHVSDGPVRGSMVCRFDADGALVRCDSDERMLRFSGDVTERWVPARWVMTRSDYAMFGTLRLPTKMTVSWRLARGDFEQVRETIESVAFDEAAGR